MNPIIKGDLLKEFYTPEKCYITEIMNNSGNAFSVAQARVEPGVTTELHTLKDTDELYYVLSGSGRMEVGGANQGIVNAGDAVFIPRNTMQRIENNGSSDLLFLCICSPRFEVANYQ